jgi:hypothetical protein
MDEVTSHKFEVAAQDGAFNAPGFATQPALQFIESVTEHRPNRYFVSKMESRSDGSDLIKAIFEWEEFQIEKRFIQGVGLRVVGFK